MPDKYFENFPIINYNDGDAVDITKRTALLERVSRNPYVFYPYEIQANERPDQFSFRYYEDQYASWLLYFTNKVLDPYYEWYLSQDEFLSLIEMKYGSVELAQRKIKFYRNNWVSEYGNYLTGSLYDKLTPTQKTYYELDSTDETPVKKYKRKESDWVLDTNKIYCYAVDSTEKFISSFKKDEIVKIFIDDYNEGYGQFDSYKMNNPWDYSVPNADGVPVPYVLQTNTVTIKHLSGSFAPNVKDKILINPNSYLLGTETNIKVKLLNVEGKVSPSLGVVVKLAEDISDEVARFWSPVTYFEYENEINEYNKTVRVMEKRYKDVAARDLKRLMKV